MIYYYEKISFKRGENETKDLRIINNKKQDPLVAFVNDFFNTWCNSLIVFTLVTKKMGQGRRNK